MLSLEDKESFTSITEFHGIILFLAIDTKLDLFLGWSQQLEFTESDVKGTTSEGAILLFYDDHIDGAGEGGRVDGIVCFCDNSGNTPHVLHVGGVLGEKDSRVRGGCTVVECCMGRARGLRAWRKMEQASADALERHQKK